MATLIPPIAGNRFVYMHVGTNAPGFGGRFALDAPGRLIDLRLRVPDVRTPTVVWLWYETFGSPGRVRMRLAHGLRSDRKQPDLAAAVASWVFVPQPAGVARWHGVAIPHAAQVAFGEGATLHVILQPDTGTFDPQNKIELISVRSRPPLPFLPQNSADAGDMASPYDDDVAVLYSLDSSEPQLLFEMRSGNSVFLPIVVLETTTGAPFGQPCERHDELVLAGTTLYGEQVLLPLEIQIDYVAMWVRGAGIPGRGQPGDNLYLDIIEKPLDGGPLSKLVSGIVLADKNGKVFKARSHWFGAFLDHRILLKSGATHAYWFVLSSPKSTGGTPDDAWIFSVDSSTLPISPVPTWLFERGKALHGQSQPFVLEPFTGHTDTGLILLDVNTSSIACIDEIVSCEASSAPGVFALSAHPGDTIGVSLLVRNIGLDSDKYGEIWAQIVDEDTGAVLVAPTLWPEIVHNDERLQRVLFIMPAAGDLHMRYEVGHVDPPGAGLAGTLIVDDFAPQTIRQA